MVEDLLPPPKGGWAKPESAATGAPPSWRQIITGRMPALLALPNRHGW